MKLETFIRAIRGKWFLKPGYANLATEDSISDIVVTKENYAEIIPANQWATYVVWFFED
jgi:hypothetical protein